MQNMLNSVLNLPVPLGHTEEFTSQRASDSAGLQTALSSPICRFLGSWWGEENNDRFQSKFNVCKKQPGGFLWQSLPRGKTATRVGQKGILPLPWVNLFAVSQHLGLSAASLPWLSSSCSAQRSSHPFSAFSSPARALIWYFKHSLCTAAHSLQRAAPAWVMNLVVGCTVLCWPSSSHIAFQASNLHCYSSYSMLRSKSVFSLWSGYLRGFIFINFPCFSVLDMQFSTRCCHYPHSPSNPSPQSPLPQNGFWKFPCL